MKNTVVCTPDVDRRIRYGPTWPNGCDKGESRLRVWHERRVAMLTECDDNPGMSITNAAEAAWSEVERILDHSLTHPTWTLVEHYPHSQYRHLPDTFDVVTFASRCPDGKLAGVSWMPMMLLDGLTWVRVAACWGE